MGCSSTLLPSLPFLSTNNRKNYHPVLRPCYIFSFINSSTPFLKFSNIKQRVVSLSASVIDKELQVSWLTPERNKDEEEYGGWAVVEAEKKNKKKKGFLGFLLMGAGVSAVILIAAIAYYSSFTRKGFKLKLNGPLNVFQLFLKPADSVDNQSGSIESSTSIETTPDYASQEKVEISASESVKKPLKRVIITVAADSTQKEALQLLKKLKIIEDDVKENALCTRREYARWLVKANLVLERNPKNRISMLPSESIVQAFDDVDTEDSDFQFIQALAEAGIVLSKLSEKNYSSDQDDLKAQERINFYPESFISRLDLINWKAQLEYSSIQRIEEISTKGVGFMDVSMISPEASAEFFMDILAGDKSILRKVFGQSRRFQPRKPATKAQAAVALTSGRLAKAIRMELSRLETENSLMLAEMEEIRSELLLRGDIQRVWDEKLNAVKAYGQEVTSHFQAAISDLEQEKTVRDFSLNESLKERAAVDCQRKLLVGLKEEVNEMSERLSSERADYAAEQKNLEDMSIDLQAKQDGIIEAKSILEAEKEALRMLRSWIEDEARRSRARAQVLEKVGRRWRWSEEA